MCQLQGMGIVGIIGLIGILGIIGIICLIGVIGPIGNVMGAASIEKIALPLHMNIYNTPNMRRNSILCLCALAGMVSLASCGLQTGNKSMAQTAMAAENESENESEASGENNTQAGNAASGDTGYELPALREGSGEQILHREGYTASYNKDTRLPNWVAWHLTADHTTGSYNRKGIKFKEDEDVPSPRATNDDYYSSGYDRGHMCPSGDCKWSETAQLQSFLYTNACPQVHGLNAGDWNEMEGQCRRWAGQYGDLYIVCGPVLYSKSKRKTIGKNKVVVPEAFFKVVLRAGKDTAAIGFIYRNESGNRPKGDYVNTVDEVERITGYDFFSSLPDEVERKVEANANLDDWF